jgi:hypothetical protein
MVMGEAKRRGTFEERQALAVAAKEAELKRRAEVDERARLAREAEWQRIKDMEKPKGENGPDPEVQRRTRTSGGVRRAASMVAVAMMLGSMATINKD